MAHFRMFVSGWFLLASGTIGAQNYPNTELVNAASANAAYANANSGLWQLCSVDPLAELLRTDTGAVLGEGEISFQADSAELSSESGGTLRGDVVVEQGDQLLQAPIVELDRDANRVRAEDVRYGSPIVAVRSKSGEVDLETESAEFDQADYYIPFRNAQGSAGKVIVENSEQQSRLEQVTYSTCPRDEEFWQLRAGELDLDKNSGRGVARDITLLIKETPVFYFPYLSFPIDERRQSGFLAPRIGIDENNGFDITVPYYWNIAPQQDATFSPRLLTDRGLMLAAEYRYLAPLHQGEIKAEYLPDDRVFEDDRSAFRVAHRANPMPRLFTDLIYQYVSDNDYIDDLENNLDLLSPNYLERRFDVAYYADHWTALARLQGFQTLNPTINDAGDDYNRLPQLLFDGHWPQAFYGLDMSLRAEAVRFDSNNTDRSTGRDKSTGNRFDIRPAISLPLEWPAGFVKPKLSYRYTAYDLNEAVNNGGDKQPTRGLPVFSVDSGLFFEKPLQASWLGNGILTLEPRLFYLYVPFEDQSDIPLFDSTEIDRNFSWLFLENRFTGADRVGDAHQLTTALTTRLLDASDGGERARASIGQVHYFRDRKVTLDESNNNPNVQEESNSDVFAEAAVQLDFGLSARGTIQWDPDQNQTRRSAFDLNYRKDDNRLVNFSHRFAQDDLEQVDLSFLWTVKSNWRTVGRWNYSLRENNTLDALTGLEYSDCCWALRMVARHHRDDPEDQSADNSIYLELELKGLATVGNRVNRLLEQTITGYPLTR